MNRSQNEPVGRSPGTRRVAEQIWSKFRKNQLGDGVRTGGTIKT